MDQRESEGLGGLVVALSDIGLSTVHMVADGNCMFRAVAHLQYGYADLHMIVREECVKHMRINSDYYRSLLFLDEMEFETYLDEMSGDQVWGGYPELVAVQEVYDRPVLLFNARSRQPMVPMQVSTMDDSIDNSIVPFMLVYSGSEDHLDGHYNAVEDERVAYPMAIRKTATIYIQRMGSSM